MKISLDFDGVVNAFDYRYSVPRPDDTEGPRPGLYEFLDWCDDRGHEVGITSARPTKWGKNIRNLLKSWGLADRFISINYAVQHKHTWCDNRGYDIHVDDHPDILWEFYSGGARCIPICMRVEGTPMVPFDNTVANFDELRKDLEGLEGRRLVRPPKYR